MTRAFRVAVLLAVAAATSVAAGRRPQASDDVSALLAPTRQALGGDAILAGITSLSVKGSRTRTPDGRFAMDDTVEYFSALPDRFVETSERSVSMGPRGMSSTNARHGFRGDDLISEIHTDSQVPQPVVMGGRPAPADPVAERARLLNLQKRAFAQLTLPMFATSFPSYPLTMASRGRTTGPAGPADAIDVQAPDGFIWTILIDAATHRPSALAWKGKPIIVMSGGTTGMMTVGAPGVGGVTSTGPTVMLPPNPAANLPDVQWQMTIADYKTADGVTWAHRFTTSVDGKKYEDLKLGTYKINPKIDPSTFRTSK